ncbi:MULTISPECIES: ABC transporter [Microbacterium]|uniref:ABC transporter n=1 Tax=Microbacterium TaxID=33882 RepID=UPI0010F4F8CB|nr:ABC transporter [Microbacterium sp. 4NA327F11]MCK9920053.1 ABC transporter [Microbacteriaceae bacterium K1510]
MSDATPKDTDAAPEQPVSDASVETAPEAAPVVEAAPASAADTPATAEPVVAEPVAAEPVVVEPAAEPVFIEPAPVAETAASDSTPWYERPEVVAAAAAAPEPAYVPAAAYSAETTTLAEQPPTVAYAPSPIFVQAPEAPLPRGNRAAAGGIGLIAAVAFGVVLAVATLISGFVDRTVDFGNVGTAALALLPSWSFWLPIAAFFVAFWFLGAILNRARWGLWVIFGILVGVAAWAGVVLGALIDAPFWQLTARQTLTLAEANVLTPLSVVAFIAGRELTIWFAAWVAARGRRITALNEEAQAEYERTLEAGPQLVHQA